MGTREEFEKLDEIAERVDDGWISFRNGAYWNKCLQRSDDFLNGAWYVFQEQQKKIDVVKSKLSDIYDASDEDETVAHLLDEIQELLK